MANSPVQTQEISIEWLEGALEWALARGQSDRNGKILLVCLNQAQVLTAHQRLSALWGEERRYRLIPDVEYLPYDHYSPPQENVVERLKVIAEIADDPPEVIITAPANLLHRLPPRKRLQAYTMRCAVGDRLPRERWLKLLSANGYYADERVSEPGCYSIRGDIIDIFASGQSLPWRIDTLDDEIVSISTFDPVSGNPRNPIEEIDLTPSNLIPYDPDALKRFQQALVELDPNIDLETNSLSRVIANHRPAQGIESYFPLFYTELTSLPELLNEERDLEVLLMPGARHGMEHYWEFCLGRYDQGRQSIDRPLLPPSRLLLSRPELQKWLRSKQTIDLDKIGNQKKFFRRAQCRLTPTPRLVLELSGAPDEVSLWQYLKQNRCRCIVCSSSGGRLNYQIEILKELAPVEVRQAENLRHALAQTGELTITVAPFEYGFIDHRAGIVVVGEEVFGSITQRRKKVSVIEELTRTGLVLNNLDNLRPDEPLIHPEHGIGRYGGIVRHDVNQQQIEFVQVNYSGGDKVFVPIDQVYLLDRYHLREQESEAPWHSLRSKEWRQARRKTKKGLDDLASKIIAVHSARARAKGIHHRIDSVNYQDFCSHFPYQETPDQRLAIQTILQEMRQGVIIDRLVVGEVGCGKTEVAMRAVFVCISNRRQALVLAPTTILCQQHYERFRERFSHWDFQVDMLSRFNSHQHHKVRTRLKQGKTDVLIATHAVFGKSVRFDSLGLMIIDEEHKFGVAQKEKLKSLAVDINVVKLSATPIPRTLQMALNSLTSLSIISTLPPSRRGVTSEIIEWDDDKIRLRCEREIFRGGQVFIVHPRVSSLQRLCDRIRALLPDARVRMVHGQNHPHDIESAMMDFYHQRCDILVSTQIVENGVDFPSANTIIVNDATAFGLSSLHQLRGRVGRSHIGAYAYFIVPPESIRTPKAQQRLHALKRTTAEGAERSQGFLLAMADLEMRGTGDPLGSKQTGNEVNVGFSTFMTELGRTLHKHGSSLHEIFGIYEPQVVEINTLAPAFLPEQYIPLVSDRLRYYRAIHYAGDRTSLYELRARLYEKFGDLPSATENLFAVAELRQRCQALGVRSVGCKPTMISIEFNTRPRIILSKLLRWVQRHPRALKFDAEGRIDIRHGRLDPDASTPSAPAEETESDDNRIAASQIRLVHRILDYLREDAPTPSVSTVHPTPTQPDPLLTILSQRRQPGKPGPKPAKAIGRSRRWRTANLFDDV